MKKFILMFALLISAFVGVNGQVAFEKAKLTDNIYIGVNGGVSTPLNFKHASDVNPLVGITIGKNWTPIFGTEIQGGVALNDEGLAITDWHTSVSAINTGLNATINFSNLFCKFNPNRVFDVQTVTGIGWTHLCSTCCDEGVKDNDELTAKTGLRFNFNLGKSKAWSINIEPSVLWNLTPYSDVDKVQFNRNHAQLALNAGVAYKFKTSNGTHNFKMHDIGLLNDEINNLREENAKKPKEIVREIIREKVVDVDNQSVIFFKQGKSDLDDFAKESLNKIPEGSVVDVVGHASPEGSDSFNQALSEKRAKTVADYLTNRGVTVNKVIGEGNAGTPKNRVVIITNGR